jgi:hypothetical protein
MLSVGFEPAIPSSERLQTHDLNRAAIDIGTITVQNNHKTNF